MGKMQYGFGRKLKSTKPENTILNESPEEADSPGTCTKFANTIVPSKRKIHKQTLILHSLNCCKRVSDPKWLEPKWLLLLLLFQTRRSTLRLRQSHRSINCATCCRSPGSQTPGDPATPGSPQRRRTLHHPGLEKLALNSGTTGGARKMAQNASKNPSSHPTAESNLSLLRSGMSTKPGDELNLRHSHCSREKRLCMVTGTSITTGTAPALQGHRPHSNAPQRRLGICRCTQRACERLCPGKNATSATVGSRPISHGMHP